MSVSQHHRSKVQLIQLLTSACNTLRSHDREWRDLGSAEHTFQISVREKAMLYRWRFFFYFSIDLFYN